MAQYQRDEVFRVLRSSKKHTVEYMKRRVEESTEYDLITETQRNEIDLQDHTATKYQLLMSESETYRGIERVSEVGVIRQAMEFH